MGRQKGSEGLEKWTFCRVFEFGIFVDKRGTNNKIFKVMYHTKQSNFNRPAHRQSFFDDAFVKDLFNVGFRSDVVATPSANIKETKDQFHIELMVPGWNKEDFNISLEKNTLVISADKKEEQTEEGTKFTRREWRQHSFKRRFELSEVIDSNNISAQYTNGILTLALPKKQEAQAELVKRIEIA